LTETIVSGGIAKSMFIVDANGNPLSAASSDIVENNLQTWIRAGQGHVALYQQTVGGAAQGFYGLSVFNPATSGKNVLFFSARGSQNFTTTTVYLFINTVDPILNATPTTANMKAGGGASAMNVTASSSSITFPSSTLVEDAPLAELLPVGSVYLIPPGYGAELVLYCQNSQQYSENLKWIEY
jgi:hypothetical protein